MPTPRAFPFFLFSLVVLLSFPACSDADESTSNAPSTTITWGEPLVVQEDEGSLLVNPVVSVDPQGGYLVADAAEGQVRRYDDTGKLVWRAGRQGDGPGEYARPVSLNRLDDSTFVALDHTGRATVLGTDGAYILDFALPFRRVDGARAVGTDRLLVSGVTLEASGAVPLLHVVDVRGERIESSFFPLPELEHPLATRLMAYAQADVNGDTVAIAFAGLDSVYIYTLDGERQRSFRLPVEDFRLVGPPPADFSTNPRSRVAWLGSFETVTGIWWVGKTRIMVAYRTTAGEGMRARQQWHRVLVTRTGELLHHETDSGKVLAGFHERPAFVTVPPASEAPNVWRIGTVGS